MRTTQMLLGLLVLWHQQADLSRLIDFTSPPARVERVLSKLEKETGIRFVSAPSTQNDVLVLRVKQVSLRALMDKIAEADRAEWQERKDAWALIRSDKAIRTQQSENDEWECSHWSKPLSDLRAEIEKESGVTSSPESLVAAIDRFNRSSFAASEEDQRMRYQMLRDLESRIPLRTLSKRIAAALAPKQIVDLPDGYTNYSNRPTAMERQLTPAMAQALSEMTPNQRALAAAVQVFESNHIDTQDSKPTLDLRSIGLELKDPRYIITCYKWGTACTVRVIVVDGGTAVRTPECTFYADFPEPEPDRPSNDARLIEYSSEITALADAVRFRSGDFVSADVRRKLAQPEIYDPLAFSPAAGFVRYAELKDLNVVARLTDSVDPSFNVIRILTKQPSTDVPVNVFERRFRMNSNWRQGDGWLVVKPPHPTANADRRALGRLFRSIAAAGNTNLDDLADFYASNARTESLPSLINSYAPILQGHLANLDPLDPAILAFYGSLSSQQKAAIWTPQGLSISTLGRDQRAPIEDLVFVKSTYLRPFRKPVGNAALLEGLAPETLPDGLPPTGFIQGSLTRGDALLQKTYYPLDIKSGISITETLTIADLASMSVAAEMAHRKPPFEVANFCPVTIWGGRLNIVLSPDASMFFDVKFFQVPTYPACVPFVELPSDIRQNFEQELAKRRIGNSNLE